MIKLFPWQEKGFLLAKEHKKYGIFLDKGLGKSLLAVSIASQKIYDSKNGVKFDQKSKVLVTTKRDLIQSSWKAEMANFPKLSYADLSGVRLEIIVKRKILDNYVDLFFINHEKFRLYYDDICDGIGTLIIDESSVLKNPHSQTTIAYIAAVEKYKFDNIYLLSGKPAPNNETEYFSQIRLLNPTLFGNEYTKFERKYFHRTKQSQGRLSIREELKDEFTDKLKSVSFFVESKDVGRLVGKNVVEKVQHVKYFDLNKEQEVLYNEYLAKQMKFLRNNLTKPASSLLPHIGILIKCVEIFCGFLIDTKTSNIKTFDTKLYDLMYSVLQEHDKDQFIICCSFDYEQAYICQYLTQKGHSFGAISGQHNTSTRKRSLDAFKYNYVQHLVAKTKTIKFGHNLQNCHRMVYTSHSLSNDDYGQSSGRVHRGLTQEKDCYYTSLLARNTISEVIYNAIQTKENISLSLLNYLKQKI